MSSGLSLLDHFRPPDGYRTTAAVATTYSADLTACLALLVAMDGAGSDTLEFSKINALRALERLRDRVRIVAHANRVVWTRGHPRIMALFDRAVRTIAFDGRRRSFHPKVVLARQQSDGGGDRYVLSVGSRNLTSSSAWDFGVGITGERRSSLPAGYRRLPDLRRFVLALGRLIDDPELPQNLGDLDSVAWRLPPAADRMEFRFHDGRPRAFADTALAALPARGRVLLISPYLSATMIRNVATHFAGADDVRLVSGASYLDKIARTGARRFFKSEGGPLDPYALQLAPDDAPMTAEVLGEEDSETLPEAVGLHAKIFAVVDDARAHLIVTSANLTHNAWLHENWEASLVLAGAADLVEGVWDWAKKAQVYRLPATGARASEPDDPVDDLRNALAVASVRLEEGHGPARLRCADVPSLLSRTGCRLAVTRLTTPKQWVAWDARAVEVQLLHCPASERTAFILARARHAETEATWIQAVDLDPPLDASRDREIFVSVLGVDDFLRYLESLLDENVLHDGGEGTDENGSRGGSERRPVHGASGSFRLETLLRRLAADARALHELDGTVVRYRDLFNRSEMRVEERTRLERFLQVWEAVAGGMRMP